MATYPNGYRAWPTKRDLSQTIIESHTNDVQDEIRATQTVLGVNPQIANNNPGGLVIDYTTVADRLTSHTRGEHLPYYQGAVRNYRLNTAPLLVGSPGVPAADPDGNPLRWVGTARRQLCKELPTADGKRLLLPYHYELADPEGIDTPWVGLPLEADALTVSDGGWQRLPIRYYDDPFVMGVQDGVVLNETGLWMISLKVDHTPDADTRAVRARRRARLEINGRDATLHHMVRQNEHNGDFLINTIHWSEVLKRGTRITASARIDGTDLTDALPINAYLRVYLVRCTEEEDDGMLRDFPRSIYTPPPPPPPPAPPAPTPPRPGSPSSSAPPADYSGGHTVVNINGNWYAYYGYGTVGPVPDDGTGQVPSFDGPGGKRTINTYP
ncbi:MULTISPECIES: hypothetical protein [Streptosporangium]|uniref:Uncharacterized protein n=1 Tax=Streptosporangium brasiliense TaxID=47480 RepID=A0ABT9RMZ3_9ACTN|nr:hypothetical protein [Streptosporangium brasiliense]MDP9870458.1 hypothetical protein [Streptosporangium brasiliense]